MHILNMSHRYLFIPYISEHQFYLFHHGRFGVLPDHWWGYIMKLVKHPEFLSEMDAPSLFTTVFAEVTI